MLRNFAVPKAAAIVLATEATVLNFPPVGTIGVGPVPDGWKNQWGVIPQMLLRIWTKDTAVELTNTKLYVGVQQSGVLADDDVDLVDFANNELDVAAHAYQPFDGPVQLTTATTLPTGLALVTNYWIVPLTAGTIKVYASLADAIAGAILLNAGEADTFAVAFSDVGVGTHTIIDIASTMTTRWNLVGVLGPSQSGAISLALRRGYQVTADHHPGTIAYAVTATIDTDSLNMEMLPHYQQ